MPWTKNDYPATMKNLAPKVRHKAIEVANAIEQDDDTDLDEGQIIATAIDTARDYYDRKDKDTTYHVKPYDKRDDSDKRWQVIGEGNEKPTETFETKEDALDKGRELAKGKNARLVVYKRNGERERVMYA